MKRWTNRRSSRIACRAALQGFEHTYSPASKNRGIKKAPFVVLIGANMPSILTEIGFLSNSREEALLRRPDHRQKLAEALYRGVSKYAAEPESFSGRAQRRIAPACASWPSATFPSNIWA